MILYLYDRYNSLSTPITNINGVTVTNITGNTVSAVHEKILANSDGFIIISTTPNSGFVVQSENDMKFLTNILSICGLSKNITVLNSSLFSSNASKNIMIDKDIAISDTMLKYILTLFFKISLSSSTSATNAASTSKVKSVYNVKSSIYTVKNTRSGEIMFRSKRLDLCKSACDENPSCVVLNSDNVIVHRSNYNKTTTTPKTKLISTRGNSARINLPT